MNAMSLAGFRSTRGSLLLIGVAALALASCGGGTAKKTAGTGGSGGAGNAPTFDKCLTDPATADQLANIGGADIARGGRLYDAWFEETGVPEPTNTFPLWDELPDVTSSATGSATWRCKTCHGWDYAGVDGANNVNNVDKYTGVPGLLAVALEHGTTEPEQIFCGIKSGIDGTNGKHNFGAQMADEDILDLTKFVAEQGVIDTSGYIASNMGTNGDTKSGLTLYKASCGSNGCHASTGTKNAGDETLGIIATENPWEFLHKVRFGDPADSKSMYSFEQIDGLTPAQIVDIIAYAQATLEGGAGSAIQPDPPITGGGGGGGGGVSDFTGLVLGGRLYDNHFDELGKTQTIVNPLFETQTTNTNDGNSWRCKECHGWDYKGVDGVYGDQANGHYTGFPGILDNRFARMKAADATPTGEQNAIGSAFGYLKTGFNDKTLNIRVHAFGLDSAGKELMDGSPGLDDTQLRALAEFVVNGLVDTTNYIDVGGPAHGEVTAPGGGDALYAAAAGATGGGCSTAACHGPDGNAIDFVDKNKTTTPNEYVGTVAVDDPWEIFHRISFGVPGEPTMPSAIGNGMSAVQVLSILDYAQSLPTE